MEVCTIVEAVAEGRIYCPVQIRPKDFPMRGAHLRLQKATESMTKKLQILSIELMRVISDVGIEGRLGARARAEGKGLSGTWKELVESLNLMILNLTEEVRAVAEVTTAVARGDLSKKMTAEAKGEILELKNTINTMVDQLNSFASEVTRVAREVGTEGKLGGQANVAGVGGVWKDLTDNVFSINIPRPVLEMHFFTCVARSPPSADSNSGEHHGSEPDQPGARHRRSYDRCRQRCPLTHPPPLPHV